MYSKDKGVATPFYVKETEIKIASVNAKNMIKMIERIPTLKALAHDKIS